MLLRRGGRLQSGAAHSHTFGAGEAEGYTSSLRTDQAPVCVLVSSSLWWIQGFTRSGSLPETLADGIEHCDG